MLQHIVHYSLHLFLPALVAYIFFRSTWKKTWLLMLATMFVDADHLLADPIFQANRCSIGFHVLHSYWAIALYAVLLIVWNHKTARIIFTGLLLHMLTDYIDCLFMGR